jgi:hypothetical protein
MRISVRQLVGAVAVSFCAGSLVSPVFTQAQSAAPTPQPSAAQPQATFMLVEFMKVPDGQTAAWVKLEQETWKPMHALRVKDGTIASWAMIAQQLPGDESNGPVVGTVTTFRGWPDPTRTDWPALLKRAHPDGNIDTLMQHTEATRKIVRSEIWQVLDQTDPTTPGGK